MPMEIRSASRSSGKIAAINAANTPVITVDTCGVLKRGWQRLMNDGSSPSSAIDRSMRGCPRSEVRMTEVMPAMTPTLRIHDSQASCGWASSATATGASESSFWNGTMPVRTVAIATYSTAEMTRAPMIPSGRRSEEHTSELQSPYDLVCRLLLEKKKKEKKIKTFHKRKQT